MEAVREDTGILPLAGTGAAKFHALFPWSAVESASDRQGEF